ncbi:type II toxin-antitoxin system Phd/YefM family antitoxin [Clostridium neonatale]|uniref:type II toxin-antitoxin system Phd/YefM family antitoxin n=1 Tax=Clostridium neonatale TaxID=137838 RepID=UPI00291C1214|nr:type II toxin-antitoxin system prevent-host-death family antitoxin [Clostridium neonatale]CAI3193762.1 Antitoxin [Clostridium neonatale]CAI3210808.1 Antitoxin [Clostridium neonatale]
MIAVNYTNLRDNLKSYCDKVNDDFETVVVTRKNNRNVVILSEESYNNMLENIYVRSSNVNYERLINAKKQIENALGTTHDLIEVDDND